MTNQRKAEVILLSLTFIWGTTFTLVKDSLNYASPLLFIAVRFLFATIFMTIFFYRQLKDISSGEIQRASVLGILLFMGFATQTIGLQYTTASKSAFFTGTTVIFTPLLQFIIERKPPLVGNIFGVIIVTLGLYFLTSPKGSEFNFGDGLTLVCAVIFAIYIVYIDIATQSGSPLRITYIQIFTNGILSLIFSFIFEDLLFNLNLNLILSILYLSLLATILTLFLQAKWQKETTPTKAAIIFTIEPLVAAFFAYLFLNENLGLIGIIGGILIIMGLILSELSENIKYLNLPLTLKE